MNSKVFLITLNIILVFFVLRLLGLQVKDHYKYSKLASENAARTLPILAPRGIIFDRNNKVLLKNRPLFKLYVLPHLLPDNRELVFRRLADILSVDVSAIYEKFKEKKKPIFEGVLIDSDIPTSLVSRIEEERPNLPGVEVISYPMRSYAFRKAASHVLGYVGEIEQNELYALSDFGYRLGDLLGKDGVEKYYDKYLRGASGGRKIEVDAFGRPLRILEIVDPTSGNDAVLTLDIDLQLAVEKSLEGFEGAVVVINPSNGEILALASNPSYDADKIKEGISQYNHPFMNRALSTYPPGSTFKVVTLLAALAEGKTTPSEIFTCRGYYQLGKRTAKCWREAGHGRISPVEGLVWSCDVVFYELGRRLGPDLLNKYALMFGLSQKTDVDLPQEKRGFIPTSSWKKERFKENWYEGDSINMGIGQGFIQTTPLQMALLYSEVATGRLMKPYIVKKIIDKSGKIIYENRPTVAGTLKISPEKLALIRSALKDVVLRGTGVAAYVPGIPASGKTGTAENPGRAHAWFICFAPSDTPEIAIASFVAHGEHGDRASAYIARDILKWYKENRMTRKMEEKERPPQYIMHGGFKEYYRKVTLDSR